MSTYTEIESRTGNVQNRALPRVQVRFSVPQIPVLCADLDGTLIKSDLLWECILVLLKTAPWSLLLMPFWLSKGVANLKRELAERAVLKPASLPFRSEVVEFLQTERGSGRVIVLATAADRRLADGVAHYLGLFDEVCASDGKTNLRGKAKAKRLTELFHEQGFEYIGDSISDLEVWHAAKAAYVVGGNDLARRAAEVTTVRQVFPPSKVSFKTWIQALRGHHWFKNVLLFVPLALAHRHGFSTLLSTAAGFVLFGICASGLYIMNDLLDLHSDRGHPWKHKRPFAAGDISIPGGLLISCAFLAGSLNLAFILSAPFAITLCLYAVLTMWYSISLKKIVLLDVFVLSSFYSVRLLAGALIASIPLSQWFLVFSLFFFLSLAMAKRYSELVHAQELITSGRSGRGYIGNDREVILVLGIASSFASVIILSLYVHSQEVGVLYRNPEPLLLLCPIILYWLSRLWLQAHRGDLHDDPITLAIGDPVSYAVGAASALAIAASVLGLGV
jgi:4-hydroxybenzoate polyprenyltransferase/phosphoserine phosphatase